MCPADAVKPDWLRTRLDLGRGFERTRRVLNSLEVSTVCAEARCPNRSECWSSGTATFEVLGDLCTRSCGFCAVETGVGGEPDPSEPGRVAAAAGEMGLDHAVLTSVTRDDLPDMGAGHLARCVSALRETGCDVEVLVPDFRGDIELVEEVLDEGPAVLGHNVETVERLQGRVRGGEASFERSLAILEAARECAPSVHTKSSMMLGLGETREEVLGAMVDLRRAGVVVLTLGQYLRPSRKNLPVERYVPPGEFEELRERGEDMGFGAVAAGPFVRSSYRAGSLITELGGGADD